MLLADKSFLVASIAIHRLIFGALGPALCFLFSSHLLVLHASRQSPSSKLEGRLRYDNVTVALFIKKRIGNNCSI